MKVTKAEAEVYHIRGKTAEGWSTWGDIVLICSKESVEVLAYTDFGTFGYYWSHCGMDPKRFLCKINKDYTMGKFRGNELYIPDPDEYHEEVKKHIINSRLEGCLTKDQARSAWEDLLTILEDHVEGDLMYQALMESEHFDSVFGDYENLPDATKMDPHCESFWKHIWLPFVANLKEETHE